MLPNSFGRVFRCGRQVEGHEARHIQRALRGSLICEWEGLNLPPRALAGDCSLLNGMRPPSWFHCGGAETRISTRRDLGFTISVAQGWSRSTAEIPKDSALYIPASIAGIGSVRGLAFMRHEIPSGIGRSVSSLRRDFRLTFSETGYHFVLPRGFPMGLLTARLPNVVANRPTWVYTCNGCRHPPRIGGLRYRSSWLSTCSSFSASSWHTGFLFLRGNP